MPDRYGTPLDCDDGSRTPLFDGMPTREQTRQGMLNDCGTIAALGAVAGQRPEAIGNAVRKTDDGNYEVRLHETQWSAERKRHELTGHQVSITVTPELPVSDRLPGQPAFARSQGAAWSPVMEKALAGIDQTWTEERMAKRLGANCGVRGREPRS